MQLVLLRHKWATLAIEVVLTVAAMPTNKERMSSQGWNAHVLSCRACDVHVSRSQKSKVSTAFSIQPPPLRLAR